MRRDTIIRLTAVGCFLALISTTASPARTQDVSPEHVRIHQALTQGVRAITVGRLCPVIPRRDGMYPIFCGGPDAYTGNPLYMQGSYPPVVVAGRYGKGRIVACGHDGWLLERTGDSDVARLSRNALQWLAGPSRPARIALYTSIGTLVTTKTLSTGIMRELAEEKITVTHLAERASPETLEGYAVLVIARPHARRMNADEAEVICQFIEKGGGVFMAGVGWYWAERNPTVPMSDFPLNVLGSRLGVTFLDESVYQQSSEGARLPATFRVDKPKRWLPRPTKVFQGDEMADRDIHIFVRRHMKSHNFAIEGEHVVLSLPAYGFLNLRSPTKAIKDLDTVYKTHARLASNTPFHGKKISLIVVNRLGSHLCSGNPILIRRDRVPVVLRDFNGLGHPGWGIIHELGHDFVAFAHKHAYQLGDGDNESWANLFTTHAYDTLELEYDEHDTHWREQRNGIAYYFASQPGYEKLKTDNWIMLSLLTVIKETYGWGPFYSFFKKCANKAKTGSTPTAEQEKVDFLVSGLSVAAGVDLSSYFIRWGFPVSESVIHELKTLPQAQLDKAAKSIAARFNIGVD